MAASTADPVLLRVGANIAEAREALGLSQQELADRSAVHRVSISKIEHGLVNFNMVTLQRLSHALRLPPAALLTGVDLALLSRSIDLLCSE